MIDNGRQGSCDDTIAYLLGQGVSHIDYHFATHYHADHISCLDDLVDAISQTTKPTTPRRIQRAFMAGRV